MEFADRTTAFRAKIEDRLASYVEFYKKAIEQNKWYGFWNYGDVMHAYDPVRHTWRYDIGGFAWDNTELASNMWCGIISCVQGELIFGKWRKQ